VFVLFENDRDIDIDIVRDPYVKIIIIVLFIYRCYFDDNDNDEWWSRHSIS